MTERQKILSEMWHAGRSVDDIAERLGVTRQVIYTLRHQYKLPKRPRPESPVAGDPTPEEIERLKAELKAAHIASRQSESSDASCSRAWKQRQRETPAA